MSGVSTRRNRNASEADLDNTPNPNGPTAKKSCPAPASLVANTQREKTLVREAKAAALADFMKDGGVAAAVKIALADLKREHRDELLDVRDECEREVADIQQEKQKELDRERKKAEEDWDKAKRLGIKEGIDLERRRVDEEQRKANEKPPVVRPTPLMKYGPGVDEVWVMPGFGLVGKYKLDDTGAGVLTTMAGSFMSDSYRRFGEAIVATSLNISMGKDRPNVKASADEVAKYVKGKILAKFPIPEAGGPEIEVKCYWVKRNNNQLFLINPACEIGCMSAEQVADFYESTKPTLVIDLPHVWPLFKENLDKAYAASTEGPKAMMGTKIGEKVTHIPGPVKHKVQVKKVKKSRGSQASG